MRPSTLVSARFHLLLVRPIWLANDSAQHGATWPSDWSLSLAAVLSVRHVARIEDTRSFPEGEPPLPWDGVATAPVPLSL